MKRILCILLLSALALSLVACKGGGASLNADGLIEYSESGLEFALPEEMTKRSVSYADICYSDGKVEFFVYFYSRDALLTDLFLNKDTTVSEYADWFVNLNRYEGVERKLDEDGKKIEMCYVYEPEGENTFYNDIIMRNGECLIHVTLSCPSENIEEYESTFALWKKYVALTYPDR